MLVYSVPSYLLHLVKKTHNLSNIDKENGSNSQLSVRHHLCRWRLVDTSLLVHNEEENMDKEEELVLSHTFKTKLLQDAQCRHVNSLISNGFRRRILLMKSLSRGTWS